jgi:hypothetical protein
VAILSVEVERRQAAEEYADRQNKRDGSGATMSQSAYDYSRVPELCNNKNRNKSQNLNLRFDRKNCSHRISFDRRVRCARCFTHKLSLSLRTTDIAVDRQALSDLFAGAIGSYKNTQSHRHVQITDPLKPLRC